MMHWRHRRFVWMVLLWMARYEYVAAAVSEQATTRDDGPEDRTILPGLRRRASLEPERPRRLVPFHNLWNDASSEETTWIIVLQHNNDASRIKSFLQQAVFRVIPAFGVLLVSGITASTLEWLWQRPEVLHIEENQPVWSLQGGEAPLIPDLVEQKLKDGQPWGIDRVDGTVDKKYTYTWSGKGVQVYVFDTGIMTTHDEFGGRARCGLNVIVNETCDDLRGHGTHVAGTVGGKTYGLAKSVELINVKVLDKNNTGNVADVLLGLEYVLEQKAAQPDTPMIITMSLGSASSSTFNSAVNLVVEAGIFVVAAAGNSGVDACSTSPAAAEQGLTVGGLDVGDTLPSWTNYGPCVDLYAPAVSILSATYDARDMKKTQLRSGTSTAAPHVAGVLALYLEWDPTLRPSDLSFWMAQDALSNVTTPRNGTTETNIRLWTSTAVQNYSQVPPTPAPVQECRTLLSRCAVPEDCCTKACRAFEEFPNFGTRCFIF